MTHLSNETGRSLTEMLAVLGIIGVISVGVVSTVQFGMTSFRVGALYDTIETTASGVIDLYSWSRKYPTDARTMGETIAANTEVCEDCTATNQGAEHETTWGKMLIAPGSGELAETYFTITLDNVPADVCQRLSEMKWRDAEWASPVAEEGEDEGKPACPENGSTTIQFNVY